MMALRIALTLFITQVFLTEANFIPNSSLVPSLFGVSENAPLAEAMRRSPTGNAGVLSLLSHFEALDRAASKTGTCTWQLNIFWVMQVAAYIADYPWPSRRRIQGGCLTELQIPNQGEIVWKSINDMNQAYAESRNEIVAETGIEWPVLYPRMYPNHFAGKGCENKYVLAYRFNGSWALKLRQFSHGTGTLHGAPYETLIEWVERESPDSYRNLRINITTADGRFINATTFRGIKRYSETSFAQHNGFHRALGYTGVLGHLNWQKGATETLKYSELASLLLPIFLALLPLALFADVSTPILLVYTLLTDVLNMVPLLLKGQSLVSHGLNPPILTYSRVFSVFPVRPLAAAETILQKCKPKQNLVAIGSVLIVIALSLMVIGLALEIRTRRALESRKKYYAKQKWSNPNNRIELGLLSSSLSCMECGCAWNAPRDIEKIRLCHPNQNILYVHYKNK